MQVSDLFPNLSDIYFVEKEPEQIERELIEYYEQLTSRTLARADPVRLFINTVAYALFLLRVKIDATGKMNLLAYATGNYLDHLGSLLEVERLPAQKAVTVLRFTLSEAQSYVVTIPEGTRVTPDGKIFFATDATVTIKPGDLFAEVTAYCTEAGLAGNGYPAGTINRLVDQFPYEMNVINETISTDGSEIESDEAYRKRIKEAPEKFSTAGPVQGYRYHAMSADSNIIDVAVIGPAEADVIAPGHVHIYPLLTGGKLPDQAVLDKVYEACNKDNVRPDTDFVHVEAPDTYTYSVDIEYWVDMDRSTAFSAISSGVNNAVNEFVEWTRSKIGRDINPSELIARIMQAGAKRVEVYEPTFVPVALWQIGDCTNIHIAFKGFEYA